jgi:hypothetical protein
MTRFAVLVLCPRATYSDLLMESREKDVTVLEMVPYSNNERDYESYLTNETSIPILFIYGPGKSRLVQHISELHDALSVCLEDEVD